MHDLFVLPISFDLTFDNFLSVGRCRLIWREGDFLGLTFESWRRAQVDNQA